MESLTPQYSCYEEDLFRQILKETSKASGQVDWGYIDSFVRELIRIGTELELFFTGRYPLDKPLYITHGPEHYNRFRLWSFRQRKRSTTQPYSDWLYTAEKRNELEYLCDISRITHGDYQIQDLYWDFKISLTTTALFIRTSEIPFNQCALILEALDHYRQLSRSNQGEEAAMEAARVVYWFRGHPWIPTPSDWIRDESPWTMVFLRPEQVKALVSHEYVLKEKLERSPFKTIAIYIARKMVNAYFDQGVQPHNSLGRDWRSLQDFPSFFNVGPILDRTSYSQWGPYGYSIR
ncbi:hypothetical protein HYFRA_00006392 [Hymenoscyphus fraxineus]|uniref:Uncharacterized protein n=1 Tax=Hymenoscyphus fraxineus TaxID=746836 RepID=A0A9N9KNB1_9HELO|nr:hypothetical protein HYFRA_00006392 [Hymenoscyphus fraxineus]